MHLSGDYRWHLFVVITLLGVLMAPAYARPEREGTLYGITVSSSFIDVLTTKGPPHWVGPALANPDAVLDILDPPPVNETMMGGGGPMPGAPNMGPMGPGGMMPPGMGGMVNLKPKPKDEYIVWMYEGPAGRGTAPNPNAGWNTYVLFNKTGQVAGVVVAVLKPGVLPPVRTRSGVGFDTRMMDIISEEKKGYNWPPTSTRIAGHYFLSYPDLNVTFAVDGTTRKVVVIAIGVPLTVNPIAQTTQQTGPGGGPMPMMPPGGLPR